MATLRKRGAKWQVQVRRNGFPGLTKTFHLKEDALRWGREQERLIDTGEWQTNASLHMGQTLADLLRRCEQQITPNKRSASSERFHIRVMLRHPVAST